MMSPDEIHLLAAGRDMDALVATQVLGWKEVDYLGLRTFQWPGYSSSLFIHQPTGIAVPTRARSLPLTLYDCEAFGQLPFFSTEIGATKQVMAALNAANYALQLQTLPSGLTTVRVTPVPDNDKTWPAHYEAAAETMEAAICRAALFAFCALPSA